METINRLFGTYRGLIRLLLAYAELFSGRLRHFTRPDLTCVKRLVFVCQGNICRSAYADYRARDINIASASLGLAASTGTPAFELTTTTANLRGIDVSDHRATDIDDFVFEPGDLLLAMEIRQARKLRQVLSRDDIQIGLLGLWAKPLRPHIHDPYELSPAYFFECFKVIDSAVQRLCQAIPTERQTLERCEPKTEQPSAYHRG